MPSKPGWFGKNGACARLDDEIRKRNAWGDHADARYREYVSREHVDGGMPIVELHRNHGIPLSAVRQWIATYRRGGRAAIEAAAAKDSARAAARDAELAKQKLSPAELTHLRAAVASKDLTTKRGAYATIGRRKLRDLIPDVVAQLKATKTGYSVQDELELLALLGAKHELHALFRGKPKLPIMRGYEPWCASLMKKAGCKLRTVEKPWSLHYELDGRWFRTP